MIDRNLRLQEAIVNSNSLAVYRPFKPKGQRREIVRINRLKNILKQCCSIRPLYTGFWEFKVFNNNNIYYLKIK